MKDTVSEKELAARLNVPLSRLKRLRRYYDAPAHKIKNVFYYDVQEFLEWYEETIIM